ncbi:MAG: TPM domain-containing protein [Oscillospiraceae bacterium]|nr:TPM domain-containing protein [Oscillospiraceae bacterium]
MRIMKKTAVLVMMMLMLVFGACAVSASGGSHVFDYDNSLSDEEEKLLDESIKQAEQKYGLNIAIVITDDLGTKSSMEYADDFYDDMFGINTDGILFLMDNDTQWDHISTSGRAISMYSESYIDRMFSAVTPALKRGSYFEASVKFLDMLDTGKGFRTAFFHYLPYGLIAGVIISLIACAVVVHSYKTKRKVSPRSYITENETHFTVKQDRYVRQYTTKVKIESDSSSGGGTHTSSSGGTHGGHSHHR